MDSIYSNTTFYAHEGIFDRASTPWWPPTASQSGVNLLITNATELF